MNFVKKAACYRQQWVLILTMIAGLAIYQPDGVKARPHQQVPTLLYFRGTGLDNAILLEWETVTEINTLGFNLLRSDSKTGPYEIINDQLIPAIGGIGGAYYDYVDDDVVNGQTYWYILIVVKNDGTHNETIPISVTAGKLIFKYIPIIRNT